MVLNETNCPSLMYLKWHHRLDFHPKFVEFRKRLQKNPRLSLDREYPFLNILAAIRQSGNETLCEDFSRAGDYLSLNWEEISEHCSRDVWTVSGSYSKAFEKVADSIARYRRELYSRLCGRQLSGCQITADKVGNVSVFYDIFIDKVEDVRLEEEDFKGKAGVNVFWNGVIFAVMDRTLVSFAMAYDGGTVFDVSVPVLHEAFVKENATSSAGILFSAVDQIVFREFANIERSDAKRRPTRQDSPDDNEQVTVSTTLPTVTRYDATWYTEVVRTEGFARKGYFGIRWKGPRSNPVAELVPVKATFVKGYTRKARKCHNPQMKDICPDKDAV